MALSKFNFNSFDVTTAASTGLGFNASANGFSTINPGAMTLIKTLTASSSSTLSFVHGSSDVVLDSTYPVYMFKLINIHPATDGQAIMFQGSINTGSAYGVNITSTWFQARHTEDGGTTSLAYSTGKDLAQSTSFQSFMFSGNANDESCSGEIFLFNPSSTTFVKHFMTSHSESTLHDYNVSNHVAGYFNTTSAINAIKFSMSSGNIDSGTFKLYGVT